METLIDNVRNLTGRRGSPKQHNRVIYLCTRFSPLVRAIQHVNVYRAGDNHVGALVSSLSDPTRRREAVEVDIIVPPATPLVQAHGIGEAIQYSLESLEGFERVRPRRRDASSQHADERTRHLCIRTSRPTSRLGISIDDIAARHPLLSCAWPPSMAPIHVCRRAWAT